MLIIGIVIIRNASLVHSRALLINHTRELNTRIQEYTARERKVTSELYRIIAQRVKSILACMILSAAHATD